MDAITRSQVFNPTQEKLGSQNHLLGQHKFMDQEMLQSHTLESNVSYPDLIRQGSTFTEPSEAVKQFTNDFDLMRRKFTEMQASMKSYQDSISNLHGEIGGLKNENLKLNADIKIIRNEHNEMAQSIFSLETKNMELTKENRALQEMVSLKTMEEPHRTTMINQDSKRLSAHHP